MSVYEETYVVKVTLTARDVGRCGRDCHSPATHVVEVKTANGGRIASTFTCAAHVPYGRAWGLRRQADWDESD